MMNNEAVIINRVAKSGIITLNLEDYYPEKEILVFDIKDFLFKGLILKEKEFRQALKEHDWTAYSDKNVALTCSADAIVPFWAYMLVMNYLEPHCAYALFGDKNTLLTVLFKDSLSKIDPLSYQDKRVVIKGCGKLSVPESAYVEITRLLKPYVKSLMYGEPCSTVPVYKKNIKKMLPFK